MGRGARAFVVAVLVACGGCGPAEPGSGSCSEVADQLEAFSILSTHPSDAAFAHGGSGCDSDGFPSASRVYRYESDEPAVVGFYRQALAADGWQLDPSFAEPATLTGYHRRLGELDVVFLFGFDDSAGIDPEGEDDEVEQGQTFYVVQVFVPDFESEQ